MSVEREWLETNAFVNGLAMLMRGKSPTCRIQPKSARSMTAQDDQAWRISRRQAMKAVIDRMISKGRRPGKSETCRASAWPSHVRRNSFRPTRLLQHSFGQLPCYNTLIRNSVADRTAVSA